MKYIYSSVHMLDPNDFRWHMYAHTSPYMKDTPCMAYMWNVVGIFVSGSTQCTVLWKKGNKSGCQLIIIYPILICDLCRWSWRRYGVHITVSKQHSHHRILVYVSWNKRRCELITNFPVLMCDLFWHLTWHCWPSSFGVIALLLALMSQHICWHWLISWLSIDNHLPYLHVWLL